MTNIIRTTGENTARIIEAYKINRKAQIAALLECNQIKFDYHGAILNRAVIILTQMVGELEAAIVICNCEMEMS